MEFFRVFLAQSINENLLCYSINLQETSSIEPDREQYLNPDPERITELPAGEYYFTQIRKENIKSYELCELAIELQKESLWERLTLGNKLYIRTLFEDNAPVTQLWRPVQSSLQYRPFQKVS